MSLFSFVKDKGEKLIDLLTHGSAKAEETLKKHISDVGLGNPNVQLSLEGDKVVARGEVASQVEREKILLALGNIEGIKEVEDHITLPATASTIPQARFVTVQKGDTLSAIAKREYGDASKYNQIFEANKPLLSSPDKIYEGQVLRIPD